MTNQLINSRLIIEDGDYMDYKIVFRENDDSVSKNNIEKMGLKNIFADYNGLDVGFLRFIATLNNNAWKVLRMEEQGEYTVCECSSSKHPSTLYIYLSRFINNNKDYESAIDILKNMKVEKNIKSKDTHKAKNLTRYVRTCKKFSQKKKIALCALTGSFIVIAGIAAGAIIHNSSKNNDTTIVSTDFDNSNQKGNKEIIPGVSNETFYQSMERAKEESIKETDYNSVNSEQQFVYKDNIPGVSSETFYESINKFNGNTGDEVVYKSR